MRLAKVFAVLIVVLLVPTRALAQASLTGVVRDVSGGVDQDLYRYPIGVCAGTGCAGVCTARVCSPLTGSA